MFDSNIKLPITILMVVFGFHSVYSQVTFYDGTQEVLGNQELTSTVCIGINDLDGDCLDDLIVLDNGKRLKTFSQNNPGNPFDYEDHVPVSQSGEYALVSGDLDNDGIAEIIVSGNSNGSKFMRREGDSYKIDFVRGDIYSQSSNLIDINSDGYLDFFVCNDDGESLFFLNDGDGGMNQEKVIDFIFNTEQDLAGNYSSIFTDIDSDGDLDLYLGKCKAEAAEETDLRRINQLYINNGDGTFTEGAEAAGLAISKQSWSLDSGDIDNDGDLDMIVANHASPHDLMINDGNGIFTRKELIPGGYTTFASQSFFYDFDNNGWLDILLTDPGNTFILFNDEMSFSRRDLITSGLKAFSAGAGDLNFDGFIDLYLGFATSFQDPGDINDKVFLNSTNSNNYLDIKLIGTESNRDAVGAKVFIYQGERMQMREVIAGKSYGIMNSTVCHFGLGSSAVIDSILIQWPSGMESRYDDIHEINTLYTITEDGCLAPIIKMPDLNLCDGEAIDLVLPFGYDSYLWSNGETSRNIVANEPGWYRGEMEKDGCVFRTNYFMVDFDDPVSSSEVIENNDLVLCEGSFVKLKAISGISYDWSTGETSESIDVFEPGEYSVTVQGNCGTFISNPVTIDFAEVIQPEIENDTIEIGESALFEGDSEELKWYQNKNDLIPIAEGSEFETPELVMSQTYFVGEENSGFGLSSAIMTNVPLNNVGDSIYGENEFIQFDVLEPVYLKSVSARTQVPGVRTVSIKEGEEFVYEVLQVFNVGINEIFIGKELQPGTYRIGTSTEVNLNILGTNHPKFSYSEIYAEKDRTIDGYIKVYGSELYPGVSSYFFDWEVDYAYYSCEPRIAVQAVVREMVSTEETDWEVRIFPNPTSGDVFVESFSENLSIEVLDFTGNLISRNTTNGSYQNWIELPEKSGVYILRCFNGKSIVAKKVVRL